MDFIIIFGPPAVGKMTVGQELSKLTGYKLFHNHMTIDLVLNFFDYGEEKFHKLVGSFRKQIFEEIAKSNLSGFIFTYVWALELESDKKFIDNISELFKKNNANVYYVELESDLEKRLERNKTENRLNNKPSKRNIKKSEENLLYTNENHKLNSNNDFFYKDNYLKINNTDLTSYETAKQIKENLLS